MMAGLHYTPLGFEQITGLSTAKGLTVPADADFAVISAGGQAVRFRDDGTDPTAAIGVGLAVNTPLEYAGRLSALRFIEQVASATVDVSYYKIAG